jgi:acid phosphatase family membrane protein YuiD
MTPSLGQVLSDLLGNRTLWVPLTVWAGVQFWKFLSGWILQRRFDLSQLWMTGGMPSSHSALVAALAISVGMNVGFSSSLFAVSAVLAIVVMYDAAGIRQAAGKQAAKINLIVEELLTGHPLNEERLRELLGHTPLQVTVGALVGVLGAWLLNL